MSTTVSTSGESAFGGAFTWGARPALLVIDLVNGFTDPSSPLGCRIDEVVDATAELVRCAHDARIPVVFTTITYREDLGDAGAWAAKVPALRVLVEGSDLVRIDARLPVAPDDEVVVKRGASAFHGTNLASWLRDRDVDCVVVAGATSSGCVRASAVDAVQEGWPTFVVEECIGDRDAPAHAAALHDLRLKYADVIDLSTAVGHIGRGVR